MMLQKHLLFVLYSFCGIVIKGKKPGMCVWPQPSGCGGSWLGEQKCQCDLSTHYLKTSIAPGFMFQK